MCDPVTLMIAGVVISSGGSFLQANATAQAARQQAEVANDQLKVDIQNEKIRGMQEANNRQEEYLRNAATNRVVAAISSGGGTNLSYQQGIAPYNKKVMQRDLATVGFNSGQQVSRMRYQIGVNKFNAKAEGRSAYVGAVADTAANIGSAASSYGSSKL